MRRCKDVGDSSFSTPNLLIVIACSYLIDSSSSDGITIYLYEFRSRQYNSVTLSSLRSFEIRLFRRVPSLRLTTPTLVYQLVLSTNLMHLSLNILRILLENLSILQPTFLVARRDRRTKSARTDTKADSVVSCAMPREAVSETHTRSSRSRLKMHSITATLASMVIPAFGGISSSLSSCFSFCLLSFHLFHQNHNSY